MFQIHHVVVDEPYPAIILKSMYEEGKLSNQAYRTELRNFFSGLVEVLEVSALESSCIIQEDEARKCIDLTFICRFDLLNIILQRFMK